MTLGSVCDMRLRRSRAVTGMVASGIARRGRRVRGPGGPTTPRPRLPPRRPRLPPRWIRAPRRDRGTSTTKAASDSASTAATATTSSAAGVGDEFVVDRTDHPAVARDEPDGQVRPPRATPPRGGPSHAPHRAPPWGGLIGSSAFCSQHGRGAPSNQAGPNNRHHAHPFERSLRYLTRACCRRPGACCH